MRVSTAQFYFQNSQQISNKQTDVNEQVEFIASGKRVLTAKDDAVAYGTLTGYTQNLSDIEKYQRNITQAENRNSLQDTTFGNAENLMQELKRIFVQANNGTLNDGDLQSLAQLAKNSQDQLLDIANSKDETGGYIFAGAQIDKEPFVIQPDNSVIYQGDSGVRELQISKSVMVDINQPGDEAFEKVANPIGDFQPDYLTNTSGIKVSSAVITNPGNYDVNANPPNFNFVFSAPSDLTVTDGNGAVVYPTAPYTPGQTIAFPSGAPSVEVQLSGNPLPGDEIELAPQAYVSVFETIKSAIDWMNAGVIPADSTKHAIEYDEVLNEITSSLNHLTSRRADAGIRMNLIENQENKHLDSELSYSKAKSNIEDLDFAKAVATFEQSKIALQATQQTFVQIKNLSLFNYI